MGISSRIGDLLIQAKLVSPEQVAHALEAQAGQGGRLGDNLVASRAISRDQLDAFLKRMPVEPEDVEGTGIELNELLALLMKLIHKGHLDSIGQYVAAIKLSPPVVLSLVRTALERKMLYALAYRNSGNMMDQKYALTEEGLRWTIDALQLSQYVGPAPVTLQEFVDRVQLQKVTNQLVTVERIREAMDGLSIEESIIEQSGPALNSGRAILLYGPTGNGKTVLARRLASIFDDLIYVPYAVIINGHFISVYDPAVHKPVNGVDTVQDQPADGDFEDHDQRWVACSRPLVVTGAELTVKMLELRSDITSRFSEAPLLMKALGGCLIVDDFGRQTVSPKQVLNHLLGPLDTGMQHITLPNGKDFAVPFDGLIIFATNLDPEDLMESAFLRRLPYKIRIGVPTLGVYRQVFSTVCEERGLTLPDEAFDAVVQKITGERGQDLALFQPAFFVDQIVAICRFMGQPTSFEPQFIEQVIKNLFRDPPRSRA